ncbi:MAG: hypothetical protein ABW047_13990 [Nitrospiraceae bacterium]
MSDATIKDKEAKIHGEEDGKEDSEEVDEENTEENSAQGPHS